MFALPGPPAQSLTIADHPYRLVRVFKHDFFAATSLYQCDLPSCPIPRVVVKFGRTQPFCGLPAGWMGDLLRRRELAIYRALEGLEGVPRCLGAVEPNGLAVEYIEAAPLDHLASLPPGLFDQIAKTLQGVHERGIAYADANKRSNILVDPAGRAWLIDYQIAFRRRGDWPWPVRQILDRAVNYVQKCDWYHLYKHKRRLAPQELTDEQEAISRRRGGLHELHRQLTTPWRQLRRRWLSGQHRKGRLVSPTAGLEDHHQPEKATWRNTAQGASQSDK